MKSEILKGFEFIEPMITDVRTNLENESGLKLNKDQWKIREHGSGQNFSKLAVMNLSDTIAHFLRETLKPHAVRLRTIKCELKHSSKIPSILWPIQHTILQMSSSNHTVYIDPLGSVLVHIIPDVNDVYIGDKIPEYLVPIDSLKVRGENFLAWLDQKLKVKRKVPMEAGLDIDGDTMNVYGVSRFVYHNKYTVGLFEYLEYHVRGKICDWIAKIFKKR